MLGKLIKHEFKATYRVFLLFYAVLVVFTFIGKLVVTNGMTPIEALNGIMIAIYVLYIVALVVATFLYLIFRYYKNLFSDEGYLMFTLPVKPWMLFFTKIITSLVWNISTAILTIGSIAILVIKPEMMNEMKIMLRIASNYLKTEIGISMSLVVSIIIIGALISFIHGMMMIYTSINIGQLAGKHRVMGSVAAYIVIYSIQQVISVVYMFAGQALGGMNFITLEGSAAAEVEMTVEIFKSALSYSYILSIVLIIVFFIISNYILNKKLNLE